MTILNRHLHIATHNHDSIGKMIGNVRPGRTLYQINECAGRMRDPDAADMRMHLNRTGYLAHFLRVSGYIY